MVTGIAIWVGLPMRRLNPVRFPIMGLKIRGGGFGDAGDGPNTIDIMEEYYQFHVIRLDSPFLIIVVLQETIDIQLSTSMLRA